MNIGISKIESIPQKFHLLIILLISLPILLVSSKFLWTGHLHTSALDFSLNDQTGYVTTARNIAEKGRYESTVYYPAKIIYYKSSNLPPYMPGNYYIRAAFFYLFGYSVFIAFLPNLLAFIGSIILLFLIAKKFFDTKIAYITVFLFMLFPPFVLYSFSAMQEMLFVFACLLSFYLFIRLPSKNRYIYGGFTTLLPFLVRETAAFMIFGFAIMILLEYKHQRFRNALAFIAISLSLFFLVYSLPLIADRPPTFYGRLTNSNLIDFNNVSLENIHLTYMATVKLLWSHFLSNVTLFRFMLTSWPWHTGFAFFVINLFLFIVCILFLFLSRSINKPFALFYMSTFLIMCLALFLFYDYYGYTGLRLLLFMLPFSLCIIARSLVSLRLLMKSTIAIISILFIFTINIYFWGSSLQSFHVEFVNSDRYDQKCADFLDSIGVFSANFFIAPPQISLDYVNRHYPIKWSFIPANDETLMLLADKFPIDILIIPVNHSLVYDMNSNKIITTLLGDKFIMTGKRMFMDHTYLIFRASHKKA
jgi:4-amino-4-deoxy-L-arabinose transferase-like glycosyltransferase